MREGRENISPKETKTDRAVKKLEEAFEESRDLSADEIEKEILSVPGAEEGGGLEQLREKSKGKKGKKEIIH